MKLARLENNVALEKTNPLKSRFHCLLQKEEILKLKLWLFNDYLLFTNQRILFLESKNIKPNRIDYLSIGYHTLFRFSTQSKETTKTELKTWIIEM
jgi:hypothetical protein